MTSSPLAETAPASAFTVSEWGYAVFGAVFLQAAFLALLAFFGDSRGMSKPATVETPDEIPIAVQPVLDELPLLKLGSKKAVRPRLPDMWKKRAPVPVKRYEERSAPSEDAIDDPEKIPESKLADKKHEAPPEDAEIVKELTQELDDEEQVDAPELDEEGAADGVEGGTETDPLKARQVDLYRLRIAAWLNGAFTQPSEIPCAELKKLAASVMIHVGGGRAVSSYTVVSPSGNAIFDGRVQATLRRLTGQQVPPPPPMYPDILGTSLSARILGQAPNCAAAAPAPSPAPDAQPATPDTQPQAPAEDTDPGDVGQSSGTADLPPPDDSASLDGSQ